MYVQTAGAQSIPKTLRALCYASSHTEYDLVGCHLAVFSSRMRPREDSWVAKVYEDLGGYRRMLVQHGVNAAEAKIAIMAPLQPNGPDYSWRVVPGGAHGAPQWFRSYVEDVAIHRDCVLARLKEQGYGNVPQAHEGNALYHAMEGVEAAIIWHVIVALRERFGLFSHAVIHDALLISKDVPSGEVTKAFESAAHFMGVPRVRVAEKDMQPYVDEAQREAVQAGYKEGGIWLPLSRTRGLEAFRGLEDNPRGADDGKPKRNAEDRYRQTSLAEWFSKAKAT